MTTQTPHEARRERIARIIDPLAGWNGPGWKHSFDSHEEAQAACEASQRVALAKADAILADDPSPVLVEALESIREYWNRDANHLAMHDACWHAINTAEIALAAYQSTDKGDAE